MAHPDSASTADDGLWLHSIDNTPAQHTLVKGSSKVDGLNRIANYTWTTCVQRNLLLCVERVATADNPADGLSRGTTDQHGDNWQMEPAILPRLYD